jgi:hypothetical protein
VNTPERETDRVRRFVLMRRMLPMVVFRYFLRQKGWLESSVGWDLAATNLHRREGAGEFVVDIFLWSKVLFGQL